MNRKNVKYNQKQDAISDLIFILTLVYETEAVCHSKDLIAF